VEGRLFSRRLATAAIALMAAALPSLPPRAQDASATTSSDDYVLGVEDKLSISVWKEPDLLKTLAIRPDGKITFPLVGDIQAAGRTPKQLTDDVSKALEKYIKEPVVTIAVEEINSFKVFILGEVSAQGALSLHRKTRLLEAIAMSGGMTQFADKSNVVLLRYENGKDVRTRIDYRKVVSGDRPELNVFLKPGDMIFVN
jgi:polysaccharide export outer membrane protein